MSSLFQNRKRKRLREQHRMALFLPTETHPHHTSLNLPVEAASAGWKLKNWRDLTLWVTASSQGGCCVITANIVRNETCIVWMRISLNVFSVVNDGQSGPTVVGGTPPPQDKHHHHHAIPPPQVPPQHQALGIIISSSGTSGSGGFVLSELPEPPIPVSEIGPIPPPPMFSSPSIQPTRLSPPPPQPSSDQNDYDYDGECFIYHL